MRTVFVNPSGKGRRPKSYRRIRHKVYRGNYGKKNPDMGLMVRDTAMIAAGAAAGALLNRLGISQISNFYMRNAARVVAAAVLTNLHQNPVVSVAAAGAVLAPLVPEIEMQMAGGAGVKNPDELAAELSALLEADLSDDIETADYDGLSDGELEDELLY